MRKISRTSRLLSRVCFAITAAIAVALTCSCGKSSSESSTDSSQSVKPKPADVSTRRRPYTGVVSSAGTYSGTFHTSSHPQRLQNVATTSGSISGILPSNEDPTLSAGVVAVCSLSQPFFTGLAGTQTQRVPSLGTSFTRQQEVDVDGTDTGLTLTSASLNDNIFLVPTTSTAPTHTITFAGPFTITNPPIPPNPPTTLDISGFISAVGPTSTTGNSAFPISITSKFPGDNGAWNTANVSVQYSSADYPAGKVTLAIVVSSTQTITVTAQLTAGIGTFDFSQVAGSVPSTGVQSITFTYTSS